MPATDLMPLKMHLMKDYAGLLRQRLAAKGHPAPAGETDEETLTRYLNMLNRSIEPQRRVTKKAAGMGRSCWAPVAA